MTSTITAEERAAALIEKLQEPFANSPRVALFALIAAAIRDAEDAAYERAAAVVLHRKVLLGDQPTASWNAGYGDGYLDASDGAAMAINRLKSPSPPKDQGHE